jgi:ribose 1,5-bisphosphokinase PhnN
MTNQPIEEMTDRELRDAIRELRKQYRESKSVELQIRHDILMQELQEREN